MIGLEIRIIGVTMWKIKVKIKPKFIYDKKGNKIGVALSTKDFDLLIEEVEDYEDYLVVKERSKKTYKTYTLEEVENRIIGKR